MIVSFGKDGKLTVTAETSVENQKLFELVNGNIATQTQKPTEEPTKRKYTYKKRTQYMKTCPVEGCDHKAKGMDLHLRNKHGIHPDGTIHNTFTYNGGRGNQDPAGSHERPVSMPVVKTENGYRLKNQKHELLPNTDTFTRSRIIN